jgi:hypothetical protein
VSGSQRRLDRISLRYHSQLTDKANASDDTVKAARAYLREHGLESFDIAKRYRLGAVIDPLPGDERYEGMLCIPYLTRRGGVKAIKYRNLSGDGPKMAQYAGQEARLFNPDAWFLASDRIGLGEGEIDAIAATERLGIPTWGVPGVETWLAHEQTWKLVFRDFPVVFMFAHGDPVNELTGLRPGRELAKAVSASLGDRVRVIECPEGEDVASMVAAGKADWFKDKMKADDDDEEEA